MEMAHTREAYGEELVELGKVNSSVVVLDADISKSTKTNYFAKAFPERFFNVGVAEQNEALVAAGLASTGLMPFLSTYAVFATMRACEQVRTFICYPKLNVKIVASHGGITPCTDGATHQATEDLAIMRAMPNMTVIVPSDYYITKAAVRAAANNKGPTYIRLTRDALPVIYDNKVVFRIGEAIILKNGFDITLIAIGDMTHIALEAAELLEAKKISTRIIDMHTLKPIDTKAIISAAKETGAIITVEDHQINGGLGSSVAEVLVENYPVPLKRIAIRDTFTESGGYRELLEKYGLSPVHIFNASINLLKMKKSFNCPDG